MALNTKHFEILKELKKEDDLQRIASIFNQTERNMRYKIAELNENLGKDKIYIKKRKIYCLLTDEDIEKLIGGMSKNAYIYEQQERIDYIVLETILQDDEFDFDKFADILQISKSTLRADIKILKARLSKMGITLKQNSNKRYHIIYKSGDLLYYLATFLYQYVVFDADENRINFKNGDYFEKIVKEKLKKLYYKDLKDIYFRLKNINLEYTDETLNLLILLICILKNRKMNISHLDVLNKKVLKETQEFKLLEETFKELNELDIYFLTDYLLRISCDEKDIFLRHKNWIEIELGVYRLIKEFEKLKDIKLVKNKKFIDDVLFYIKPLIYRSSKGIELKNTVLREVKEVYGDTFNYLKKAFVNFEKLLGIEISDNEIGFLVPIFEVALRNRVQQEKKIIIVSSYKKNLTNFLTARLQEEFLVNIVKTISIKQIEQIERQDVDYIITTADGLTKSHFQNICVVSPILTDIDLKNLEKILPKQDKKIPLEKLVEVIRRNVGEKDWDEKKLKAELLYNFSLNISETDIESIELFTPPEDFVIDVEVFDIKDGIRCGANILLQHKYVNKQFIDEIIRKKDELYFFLNDETVIFYTEPKGNVFQSGFSLVQVQDLPFKDKRVKNLICLATRGDSEDQEIIFNLNDYFEN